MAKYGKKAGEKVEKAMHEMKEGKLKTGTGKKVTSLKQPVAIGLSEAREAGAKCQKRKVLNPSMWHLSDTRHGSFLLVLKFYW